MIFERCSHIVFYRHVEKFFAEHTAANSSAAFKQSIQRIDGASNCAGCMTLTCGIWLAMHPKS